MFRRTLQREAVLWWRGDAALSVAVVEAGLVGVRDERGALDCAPAGSVVGEAALLDRGSSAPHRTADVLALVDGTVVAEYPLVEFEGALDAALARTLLRSLLAQAARNLLLVAAAHSGHPAGAAADALLPALSEVGTRLERVRSFAELEAAFRLAYRVREASDALRADLAQGGDGLPERALERLAAGRGALGESLPAELVEEFLRVERRKP